MKLKFLGTGATDGFPAFWCKCAACAKARHKGGREIRRRSGYLLDSDTMIDFGPDVYWQSAEYGIDLTEVKTVIVTHPHTDHLCAYSFAWRSYPISMNPLTLIGGVSVFARIFEFGAKIKCINYKDWQMDTIPMEHNLPIEHRDLKILPVSANHAPGMDAFLPIVTRNDKTVLFGSDTGYLSDDSWKAFQGLHLDAVILECTFGFADHGHNAVHMGFETLLRFRDKLAELGCINSSTPVYATHFSHCCGMNHDELTERMRPYGVTTAYDGLQIEIGKELK